MQIKNMDLVFCPAEQSGFSLGHCQLLLHTETTTGKAPATVSPAVAAAGASPDMPFLDWDSVPWLNVGLCLQQKLTSDFYLGTSCTYSVISRPRNNWW